MEALSPQLTLRNQLPELLDSAGEDNSPLFDSQHLRGSA